MNERRANSDSLATRPAIASAKPVLAAGVLCWREILRFFRQKNRVIGAIGQPILFWLLFGTGMNRTFQIPGQNFSEYYIPGTLVLIVLFTAIFATISIIEDRNEGFLQSVLVAPIPRWSMVLGKIGGGTCIALIQSSIFVLLTLTLGVRFSFFDGLQLFAFLLVASIGLTCLGFVIAWRLDSTQGFHAIMNLLLMPMWLLSGAFFPVSIPTSQASWMETGLHWMMRANPVSYAVAGIRRLMFGSDVVKLNEEIWMPQLGTCWLVTLVFCVMMFAFAWRISNRPAAGDLK